jgi:hypothetical protein
LNRAIDKPHPEMLLWKVRPRMAVRALKAETAAVGRKAHRGSDQDDRKNSVPRSRMIA